MMLQLYNEKVGAHESQGRRQLTFHDQNGCELLKEITRFQYRASIKKSNKIEEARNTRITMLFALSLFSLKTWPEDRQIVVETTY